jgi:DNA-binding transcriptional MocR family regulator
LTEALTYPGFRALAAHFGIRLQGVPLDAEGIVPDALERACRSGAARVLYLTPTIHNPTTATMSERRRRDIAAVIRRFELTVLEDDAYGFLPQAGPPPLATFAPERVFYFTGMAKCVAPGLRIAFLVAPDEASALRLTAALRATTLTVPPLMAGLATQWIKDGTAAQVVAAVRGEAAARQAVARALLPSSMIAAHPEGHHVWLALQPPWTRIAFDTYLRQMNLAVTPSDAFVVGDAPLEAVRLCLGAAPSSDVLRQALERIRDALFRSPAYLSAVV